MSIVDSFQNFIYLLNNSPSINDLSISLNDNLSHRKINKEENYQLSIELFRFLNDLIPLLTGDEENDLKMIMKPIKKLGINNQNIQSEDIAKLLYKKIDDFKKNKFESKFSSFNWQVSVIDKQNGNVNSNKMQKLEIVTKINSFDINTQKYKSNIIKMNYDEFQEILTNFKKINEQLHLFKQ